MVLYGIIIFVGGLLFLVVTFKWVMIEPPKNKSLRRATATIFILGILMMIVGGYILDHVRFFQ
jgi:hypothetical protein